MIVHVYVRACICMYVHMHMHMHMYKCTRTCTCTHAHAHMHTGTYTCTCTCTCTNAHAPRHGRRRARTCGVRARPWPYAARTCRGGLAARGGRSALVGRSSARRPERVVGRVVGRVLPSAPWFCAHGPLGVRWVCAPGCAHPTRRAAPPPAPRPRALRARARARASVLGDVAYILSRRAFGIEGDVASWPSSTRAAPESSTLRPESANPCLSFSRGTSGRSRGGWCPHALGCGGKLVGPIG